jgi:hypothetical protein
MSESDIEYMLALYGNADRVNKPPEPERVLAPQFSFTKTSLRRLRGG